MTSCAVLLASALLAVACSDNGDDTPAGGELGWVVRAGGPEYDFAAALAAGEDASAAITGAFQDRIVFGEGEETRTELTSAGDWDAYLARYSPAGALLWARRIGGPAYERGWAVVDLGGDTLVTGAFQATATFGEATLASMGSSDAFVARYDAEGHLAWVRQVTGPGGVWGRSIAADEDVVVAGWLTETATFGPGEPAETELTSAGGGDMFLARFDADGDLAWARSASGSDEIEARGIAFQGDAIAVTGRFAGTAVFGPGEVNETTLVSAGEYDQFLARYAADGALLWAARIGGPGHHEPGGVDLTGDGAILVAGSFQDDVVLGDGTANRLAFQAKGGWDVFVARYHDLGVPAWVEAAGGTGSEHIHLVADAGDGGPVVAGWIQGTLVIGEEQARIPPLGRSDAFVARFAPGGGLLWVRQAGGPEAQASARGLAFADGPLVLGAFSGTVTFGPGEEFETTMDSTNGHDLFVLRLAP